MKRQQQNDDHKQTAQKRCSLHGGQGGDSVRSVHKANNVEPAWSPLTLQTAHSSLDGGSTQKKLAGLTFLSFCRPKPCDFV